MLFTGSLGFSNSQERKVKVQIRTCTRANDRKRREKKDRERGKRECKSSLDFSNSQERQVKVEIRMFAVRCPLNHSYIPYKHIKQST